MTTIEDIATSLRDDNADVHLLYAFNSVGKTRLSVAYKDATKDTGGSHSESTTTPTVRTSSSGITTSKMVRPTSGSP